MTTLQEIAEQIVRKFMRADGSQAQLQADILTALESALQQAVQAEGEHLRKALVKEQE